jgi:CRISPR-associated endonuclease Cas3-HD
MENEIKKFFELSNFNHLLSYADIKEGKIVIEKFSEHVLRCIDHWNALKKRILLSIARVLNQPVGKVKLVIPLTILLHDTGKLTSKYQEYLKSKQLGKAASVGFRHEVVSAYVLLNCMRQIGFEEEFIWTATGAVLFHHEALLQQNLRKKVSDFVGPLHNKYPDGKVYFVKGTKDLIEKLIKTELNLIIDFQEELSIKNLKSEFVNMFQFYDPYNPVDLHVRRLRVSAIQHIINVCDNRSAYEVRNGKSSPFIDEVLNGGWIE